jgi:hypothetical protein
LRASLGRVAGGARFLWNAVGCFPLGFFKKDSGMREKMRWRYGDKNPVDSAVDSATVIEIGDLVWQDVDDVKPASMIPKWEKGPEGRQKRFADVFLGVAMQRSRSGDTDPVRVATTGVFEFDCPSGTFELGDMMGVFGGPLKGDDGLPVPHLWDQQVTPVSANKYAIGRVAKRVATAATAVLIDIRSTVMTGGIQ